MREGTKEERPLTERARWRVPAWLLWAAFGLVTAGMIRVVDLPGLPRVALLLVCAGSGALATSLLWFFLLGAQRSALWALALLVPYVNVVAASYYARWYWSDDARSPALLALAGMALQLAATIDLLSVTLPPLA